MGYTRVGVHGGKSRAENMTRMYEQGRMDLFGRLLYTLLIMADRGITQQDIVDHTGLSRKTVNYTMVGARSFKIMERNLDLFDVALTEISDERGWKP